MNVYGSAMIKRILTLFTVLFLTVATRAQTAEEILSRMEAEMDSHAEDGIAMTIDVKVPVLGTMSMRTCTLGDKTRVESRMMGMEAISWYDATTEWIYISGKDEIEIRKRDGSGMKGDAPDAELFNGIAGAYELSIRKETAAAWHIRCRKSKDNTRGNDPESVEVVVAKGSYHPLSLSARISGVKMTLRDISYGVSAKQVSFNPKDYPGVTIVDKR